MAGVPQVAMASVPQVVAAGDIEVSTTTPVIGTNARICGACVREYAKYTCPRCNAPYCSLGCYKVLKQQIHRRVADVSRSCRFIPRAAPKNSTKNTSPKSSSIVKQPQKSAPA